MHTILSLYHERCKQFSQLGFVRVKQTYARIINDVLQTFTLVHRKHEATITIEFGIFPLCMGLKYCDLGTYLLDQLTDDDNALCFGWSYSPHSEDSMLESIESIVLEVKSTLLPLFLSGDSCATALPKLVEIDSKIKEKRQHSLEIHGLRDMSRLKDENLHAWEKYYMALKSRDNKYANRFIAFQISFHEDALHTMGESNGVRQPPVVIERYKEQLALLYAHKNMLSQGNWPFFDKLLLQNEQVSKQHLHFLLKR